MDNNVDAVRQRVREEGREARNLVTWSVPIKDNDQRLGRRGRGRSNTTPTPTHTATAGTDVKSSSNSINGHVNGNGNNSRRSSRSSEKIRRNVESVSPDGSYSNTRFSTVSTRPTDLRARYWQFLFDNLHRAVDEIYYTCECDESTDECNEVILILQSCEKDFNDLIERIQVQSEYTQMMALQQADSSSEGEFSFSRNGSFNSSLQGSSSSGKSRPCGGLAWEVRKTSPGMCGRPRTPPSPTAEAYRRMGGRSSSPRHWQSWADMVVVSGCGFNNTITTSTDAGDDDDYEELNDKGDGEDVDDNDTILNELDQPGERLDHSTDSLRSYPIMYDNDRIMDCSNEATHDIHATLCNSVDNEENCPIQHVVVKQEDLVNSNGHPPIQAYNNIDAPDTNGNGVEREQHSPRRSYIRLQQQRMRAATSPRREPDETRRLTEEKQWRAQRLRDQINGERAEKLRLLSNKVRRVHEKHNEEVIRRQQAMEEKLVRAELLREEQLRQRVLRAHDEEKKKKEIAFIASLQDENRRREVEWQVQQKHRKNTVQLKRAQDDRRRRRMDYAAKEEAATQRRRTLEAERDERLQEIDRRRREHELKHAEAIEKQRLLRRAAAEEKARRIEAHVRGVADEERERSRRITEKHELSSRRQSELEEQRKEIHRQKSRHGSFDEISLRPYDTKKWCVLCEVEITNDVFLVSHLQGKRHKNNLVEAQISGSAEVANAALRRRERETRSDDDCGTSSRPNSSMGGARFDGDVFIVDAQTSPEMLSENVDGNLLCNSASSVTLTQCRDAECRKQREKQLRKRSKKVRLRLVQRSTRWLNNNFNVCNTTVDDSEESAVGERLTRALNDIKTIIDGAASNSSDSGDGPGDMTWPQSVSEALDRALQDISRVIEHYQSADINKALCGHVGGLSVILSLVVSPRPGTLTSPSSHWPAWSTSAAQRKCTDNLVMIIGASQIVITGLSVLPSRTLLLALETIFLCIKSSENIYIYVMMSGLVVPLLDAIARLLSCYHKTTQSEEVVLVLCSLLKIITYTLMSSHDAVTHLSVKLREEFVIMCENLIAYTVAIEIVDLMEDLFILSSGVYDEFHGMALLTQLSLKFLSSLTSMRFQEQRAVFSGRSVDQTGLIAALQASQGAGIITHLYGMMLKHGLHRLGSNDAPPEVPSYLLAVASLVFGIMNNVALINLEVFQSMLGHEQLSEEFYHLAYGLLVYCMSAIRHKGGNIDSSSNKSLTDVLNEILLSIGYFTLQNSKNQAMLRRLPSPCFLNHLCSDPSLRMVLFPTLIVSCFSDERSLEVIRSEMSSTLLADFLTDEISNRRSFKKSLDSINNSSSEYRYRLENRFQPTLWEGSRDFFS